MPKTSELPRFRVHSRTGKAGVTWTSYYWDGRSAKMKDIPLGNDYTKAVELWRQVEAGNFDVVKPKIARRLPGRRRKFPDGHWGSLPAWGKAVYLNAERRAAQCGEPFLLTVEALSAAIKRANGRCEVSGLALDASSKRGPFYPSVDRIDSAKGYSSANIRIVCLIANLAMNTWGEPALLLLAAAVMSRLSGTAPASVAEAIQPALATAHA